MTVTTEIYEAIVAGDQKATDQLVAQALEAGLAAETILGEGLVAGMAEVGKRFECGTYFVGDMMVSARAMKAGLARLRPLLASQAVQPVGRVVIGTVQGDLHDIGKNLVAMMLRGTGYEVDDLGVNCPPEKFKAAVEQGARVVCCSALLTTTMPAMKGVVEAIKALDPKVKVVVGGAPVTREYADQIGADGYGASASDATRVVERLLAG
jgi:5-methyltetrahydrofolate--homocysteine methyltransferase